MKPQDKKTLRKIKEQLDALRADLDALAEAHQDWIDERNDATDGRFDETETGERASDEQYNLEDWRDTLETMVEEMEEIAG